MYSLTISFIVANCVLTVFNKDNDDYDPTAAVRRMSKYELEKSSSIW